MDKPSFFMIDFEGFSKVLYYVTNISDLQSFGNERTALFEICTEMYFVSLFFLNERNITTSLLMMHLKCTVVYYANLNLSTLNKPFLNYGPSNVLFCYFRFLIYGYFNEAFVENFMEKLSILIQISKIHFKRYYITEY